MKHFVLTIFTLCFMTFEAKTQIVYAIGNGGRSTVTTQLSDVRYEFIQAPTNSSRAFLVDKFEGKVWKYKGKRKGFIEIYRENKDTVDTKKVNYQLYIGTTDAIPSFLLNVHTGEIWRYWEGDDGGNTFKKLETPFITPERNY